MKSFKSFILESSCNKSSEGYECPTHGKKTCPSFKGVKTPEEIAKKYKLNVSDIQNQLKIGIPIEHEHTKDQNLATNIALQHLDEFPDYYTRLKKLEDNAKKEKRKKISEGTLHHWFRGSKSKEGKPGWVQADGSPCANEPGETKTPKCFSSGRLSELKSKGEEGKSLIKSAIRRKREQDKNQQEKSGSAKPTMVSTFAKGKKDPNYVKAEPGIKESTNINEGKKDKPGKGSGKKDACYNKVKSRYSVWPSAYACVPENSSKALTRNGWKSVEELNIGEEILTFNLYKDELEFKPILNLHRYKNAQTKVIKSGNTGFVFECTENHKWIVKIPHQKTDRSSKYQKINGKFFIETKDLLENKYNKLLLVSSVLNDGIPTKKDFIYKYGDNWIKYILDISPEQRQTWLFSSIVYDGNQKKVERIKNNDYLIDNLSWNYNSPHNKQSFGFKQKDIMHRDAFLLSGFLNGGSVVWKKHKQKNIYSCHYISNKNYKNTSNFKVIKENISDVWCPETENKTWVMLQETEGNGIITITGNSGALVKCRKVGAKNWGNKIKKESYDYSNWREEFKATEYEFNDLIKPAPIKSNIVKENYTRIQTRGTTYSIFLNWRGKYISIQMFFPQFIRPTKQEVTYEIRKIYPNAIVLSFYPSIKDPTKPLLFSGEKNEPR